jgi:hypothetical protein
MRLRQTDTVNPVCKGSPDEDVQFVMEMIDDGSIANGVERESLFAEKLKTYGAYLL